MEPTKKESRKSRTVTVAYFGNDDLTDLPNDLEYKTMLDTVNRYGPQDVRALPMTLVGGKAVKLSAETLVIVENETWKFLPTKTKRAKGNLEEDPLVKRAKVQLDLSLRDGKPKVVLVPYYVKLTKVSN